MQPWLIPTFYAIMSITAGFLVPRLEAEFVAYSLHLSTSSAQAYLSAVAPGKMALTGIVFSIAFVIVQFNAIVYSPRLVVWFARDRLLFHSLGMFVATFMYSLATLAWIDRSGIEGVPLISAATVAVMLVASVLMLSQLVQRLNNLQITRVLQILGDTGRDVIRSTYGSPQRSAVGQAADEGHRQNPPDAFALVVRHRETPQAVTSIDVQRLVASARMINGVILVKCAVGDTLLLGTTILRVHGKAPADVEEQLRTSVHLGEQRTFEQDPKFALRLLVDIAIKALSPAITDPTTAVQAIDQIEDLLRRLATCDLEACRAFDEDGILRVIYQMPTWEDYLALAFDEIRQFGSTSIQVMRRLRSALVELAGCIGSERAGGVRAYLDHLDSSIERSGFDPQDRAAAHIEDRQGLGLSHRQEEGKASPDANQIGRPAS